MGITPEEIINKEFRKNIRGYKYIEVDETLDEAFEKHSSIYLENERLNEKICYLKERIEYYKKIEENIQKTLVLAQNSGEQVKKVAEGEAELIIKNANNYSQTLMKNAKRDLNKITEDFESVKQKFNKFRNGHKNFMKNQIDVFKDLERNLENKNQEYNNLNFDLKKVESNYRNKEYKKWENKI